MADLPPYPGTPRWVKLSGIVVIVLILLVVIIVVTGVGGDHGPWRHTGGGVVLPAAAIERLANGRVAEDGPSGGPGGHVSTVIHR